LTELAISSWSSAMLLLVFVLSRPERLFHKSEDVDQTNRHPAANGFARLMSRDEKANTKSYLFPALK
jgi:hypothetical protein